MKSIVYILIAVFISSIVLSAFSGSNSIQNQHLQVYCVDSNVNSESLNESRLIMESRLEHFGLKNFEVLANTSQKSLEITLSSKVDLDVIIPLVLSTGKLEFYETYDRLDVVKLLDKNDKLHSLLNIPLKDTEIDNSSAILGYCEQEKQAAVDLYNAEHYVSKPGEGIKFTWSALPDANENYSLYLLKHKASMNKSHISKSVVSTNKSNDKAYLTINFNAQGTIEWLELTKRNIGQSIAIVLDEKVYIAPKVMEQVKDGSCLISGNFTKQEIAYLNSLTSTKELPLAFTLKR